MKHDFCQVYEQEIRKKINSLQNYKTLFQCFHENILMYHWHNDTMTSNSDDMHMTITSIAVIWSSLITIELKNKAIR